MSAVDVVGQLVDQIPLIWYSGVAEVPEMMVGVANGELGFQGGFLGQGVPVISSEWHDRASKSEFGGPILTHV